MKHLLLLMISLSISQTINGQQINLSSNHYRNGDVLEKNQVTVKGFSLNGSNGVWSLEDADISKKAYSTEYTDDHDTIMMLERGNRTYYNIENGLVSIISSENAQEIISYDMPETWRDVRGLSPDIQGGTSGNKINGVSSNNPKRMQYEQAREKEFDK